MNLKRHHIILAGVLLTFLLSLPGLYSRLDAEKQHRNAAMVLDYKNVKQLAIETQIDLSDILSRLKDSGASAVMLEEYTGLDIAQSMPVKGYGPLGSFGELAVSGTESNDNAVIALDTSWEFFPQAKAFLTARFPDCRIVMSGSMSWFVLNENIVSLEEKGILPDFQGISVIKDSGMKLIYRPAPSPSGPVENVVNSLSVIQDDFGKIDCLSPSGEVVTGYPDIRPLAQWVLKNDIPAAQVEFSRQLGAVNLNWNVFPNLLSMHSVTPEEILSRRISDKTLFERMLRAARERSVRLLVMRSSYIRSTDTPLQDLEGSLIRLGTSLKDNGIEPEWPEPYGIMGKDIFAAFALALVLILSMYAYFSRLWPGPFQNSKFLLLMVFIWLLAGSAVWVTGFSAKLTGAFAASFAAAEASLIALEGWKKPFRGVIKGFIYAVVAGLAVAAFFGTTIYMVRLKAFSGVKITLLLPPLLVLFHDLKRRIHPESLSDIISRPALWGEILLLSVLGLGAVIVLFRSGNVQLVPGWEITLRDQLERLLIARPRSKELFAGFPLLFLWYLFRRKDLWGHYREVFRIGSTLAFASIVNSFCHFHTRLYFILLREFNGLWTGIIFGIFVVSVFSFVVFPLWGRYRGVFMD